MLQELHAKAGSLGLATYLVQDAGHTQVRSIHSVLLLIESMVSPIKTVVPVLQTNGRCVWASSEFYKGIALLSNGIFLTGGARFNDSSWNYG